MEVELSVIIIYLFEAENTETFYKISLGIGRGPVFDLVLVRV